MRREYTRRFIGLAAATMGLLLGGCDAAWITVDLGTDPPADPAISRVQANLKGLEFRRDGGTTPSLEFRSAELVDLLDLRTGDPLRLFTNEELPAGRYTGMRLLFDRDQDDSQVTTSGGNFDLQVAEGPFVAVDFSVEDERRSEEEYTLVLDLRQSLAFDDSNDRYTLTPVLRVVETADAARIEGSVAVTCPAGTVLAADGAVYLFPGRNAAPDDLDGNDAEPLATTGIADPDATGLRYELRFLSSGDYTLAFTCDGSDDALGVSDDLEFRNTANVEIGKGDVLQRDFN
jgi:hypothetical protein